VEEITMEGDVAHQSNPADLEKETVMVLLMEVALMDTGVVGGI